MTHEHDEDDRQRHMTRAANLMTAPRVPAIWRLAEAERKRVEWEAFWREKAREPEEFKHYTPDDVMLFYRHGLTLDNIRELDDADVSAEAIRVWLHFADVWEPRV